MAVFAPGGLYDTGGRSYRPPVSRGVISAPRQPGSASPYNSTINAVSRNLNRNQALGRAERGLSRQMRGGGLTSQLGRMTRSYNSRSSGLKRSAMRGMKRGFSRRSSR